MMGVMVHPLVPQATALPTPMDFDAWMRAEQRRVFLLCRRMLQEADEADMATQDVFLKAYKALQQSEAEPLQDPAKWLTRIAVNTCLDRLRSRAWKFWQTRPRPEDEETILRQQPGPGVTAEDQVYGAQIAKRLSQAMGRLSDRQRAVFTLRHYEDCSLEEIAVTLGLDVGTVKAHMSRALQKLRTELKDLYAEPNRARG